MSLTLDEFIKFISENYCAEIYQGKVELVPFNNMQHDIITDTINRDVDKIAKKI